MGQVRRRHRGSGSLPLCDRSQAHPARGVRVLVTSGSLNLPGMMTSQVNAAVLEGEKRPHLRRLVLLRTLTILIGLIAGLSAAEVGLRIVERGRLGDRVTAATLPDPQLGTLLVPFTTGHDANGFRNAPVRAQSDILALWDSQK